MSDKSDSQPVLSAPIKYKQLETHETLFYRTCIARSNRRRLAHRRGGDHGERGGGDPDEASNLKQTRAPLLAPLLSRSSHRGRENWNTITPLLAEGELWLTTILPQTAQANHRKRAETGGPTARARAVCTYLHIPFPYSRTRARGLTCVYLSSSCLPIRAGTQSCTANGCERVSTITVCACVRLCSLA
jgi:hypothetical protein